MEQKNLNETKTALNLGWCSLQYKKLNGEIRWAKATTKDDLIPKEKRPQIKKINKKTNTNPELVHYFDFDSNGYRCFWLENLISLSVFHTML